MAFTDELTVSQISELKGIEFRSKQEHGESMVQVDRIVNERNELSLQLNELQGLLSQKEEEMQASIESLQDQVIALMP